MPRKVTAVVANLPRHIAQREAERAAELLNWGKEHVEVVETRKSSGPGNIVMIEIGTAAVTEVFSAFERVGTAAEEVASEAVHEARAYLASTAAIDEHLADQILLPMALAGGGSFTAENLSVHARTNMEAIRAFLPVRFDIGREESCWRVRVGRE